MGIVVEKKQDGFFETLSDGDITSARFFFDGLSEIYYANGRKLTIPQCGDVYQRQFGIPFSLDGKLMFYYSWEKGVEAISLETGETVWKLRAKHAGRIAVYDTYIIVIQQEIAVLKVDIGTGEILARIGCDAENRFDLEGPYQLIDSIRGKLSVLDTRDMTVRKKYSRDIVNPNHLPTCIIREAKLEGNVLSIFGFEESAQSYNAPDYYTRVIDKSFSEGL